MGHDVLISGACFELGRISLYGGLVMESSDVTIIVIDDGTWWTHAPDLYDEFSPFLVHLCAGTGAMSFGAKYLGGRPMVVVEWNSLAVGQLQSNHEGTILQLDTTANDAARKIHQACEKPPCTLLMGFPCQLHSVQGRQLGNADPRAGVLWHGLRIAYMLQFRQLP